ncbi:MULTISPECIES: ABC transporter substrate-binding protein [Acidiphilium]|uniref:Amino acid/amide ABC transporter substrate-binding protein, HAAT family n=1 Tax=Acidiphilium rubrum TaxID=526 RepID=A0A8G2FLI9_ACIRU|nr:MULTISPECIES: ABC transporter substrate-binding protein [Acidiphilium]MBW4034249.1 ABC transporter substrate-binding protein [Pseudomonadota bacterium]SIR08300.1 amino acid/amide ABC transporter substrate-binding protein, HAAT family [Acidiphilium rubrum]
MSKKLCTALLASAASLVVATAVAQAATPLVIGITTELGTIPGKAIANGATLAADQINASGGVDGRQIKLIIEDDHLSTTDAIRSFQRMVKQDHAVAVVGTFVSEVALALEPWAARLHEPYMITGAAANELSEYVHADYKARQYIFHAYLPAADLARAVCDASKQTLVDQFHMTTAVVMSEDAAWTKPLDAGYDKCLPTAGLKVLDNIRFAPNTTDFTPIYQKIEALHPNVIIDGWAHVGVQPTVQWAEQKVPIAMAGINAQSGSSVFWKATNGATEGVITGNTSAPGVAITPKTLPFTDAYQKKFGISPAYSAYSTFDAIYALKDAIERAKSTKPLPIVDQLAKTDMVGTQGQIAFEGPSDKFTHALKYGPKYVTGVAVQWQKGEQKCIWPLNLANAKPAFPSFVKLPAKS